jgi:hypothetical protein
MAVAAALDLRPPREAGLREAGLREAGLREAGLREAGLRGAVGLRRRSCGPA